MRSTKTLTESGDKKKMKYVIPPAQQQGALSYCISLQVLPAANKEFKKG